MKTRISRAKNFVVRNERKILVTALVTTTGAAVLFRGGLKQHDAFLRENGLYEKFYELVD